jgi:hypothetical protein
MLRTVLTDDTVVITSYNFLKADDMRPESLNNDVRLQIQLAKHDFCFL